ncbi:hypothetical protein KCP74_14925 [Salmonella enterica subsp. enterica]|nr:hypothetical protein KCP74_14925 [Salmonella enterica subsp. enterica]
MALCVTLMTLTHGFSAEALPPEAQNCALFRQYRSVRSAMTRNDYAIDLSDFGDCRRGAASVDEHGPRTRPSAKY